MALTAEQRREAEAGTTDLGGGLCWYLTGNGDIIRGQTVRDPDWEDRKAEVCGGLKFLGRARYGPGGDALPALRALVARRPELQADLQPFIDKNLANKANAQYEIAHREELKLEREARREAIKAAAIARAVRLMAAEDEAAEEEDATDETPRRRPGRPRRNPAPEE